MAFRARFLESEQMLRGNLKVLVFPPVPKKGMVRLLKKGHILKRGSMSKGHILTRGSKKKGT